MSYASVLRKGIASGASGPAPQQQEEKPKHVSQWLEEIKSQTRRQGDDRGNGQGAVTAPTAAGKGGKGMSQRGGNGKSGMNVSDLLGGQGQGQGQNREMPRNAEDVEREARGQGILLPIPSPAPETKNN